MCRISTQPWRFLSVYEFETDTPEIDLPALGPLLANARDAGLIDDANESERIFSYAIYADWRSGPNHQKDKPLSGMFIIPANFVAGMEADARLIEHVEHAGEVGPQLRREPDALRLTAGERLGRTVE